MVMSDLLYGNQNITGKEAGERKIRQQMTEDNRHTLIRGLRLDRGMTQAQVAEAIGISVRALQYLEQGRTTPTAQTLAGLRRVLGDEVLVLLDEAPSGRSRRGRPKRSVE